MLKENKNNCFSTEELMAYLYGEVAETDLGRLDRHLGGCRTCTDDFAAISESRFSIYEWQRTDFADLATPMITGPWNDAPVTLQSAPLTEKQSFGERLRNLIPSFRTWAFAFGAAAVVVVVIWIGFVNLRSSVDQGVAQEQKQEGLPDQTVSPVVKKAPPQQDIAAVKPLLVDRVGDSGKAPVSQSRKPTRQPASSAVAANHLPGTHHRNIPDLYGKRQEVASSFRKVPNLSGIEEDEDRTVRLADLFAEVGSDNENN